MTSHLLPTLLDSFVGASGSLDELRAHIRQLAVRGFLTSREPEDDPPEVLLDRLRERAPARKGSGSGDLSAGDVRIQLDVPSTWAWIPLRDVGVFSGGMTPSKSRADFWNGSINWFSAKDIKTDELIESELKITPAAVDQTRLRVYETGSLVIVVRSGILKRTLPVAVLRCQGTVNQDLKVLTPNVSGLVRYLQLLLRGFTPYILSELVKGGTTVQSVKFDEFISRLFPFPPLAEQQRIVAKVDELMALCDELETAQVEKESLRDQLVAASLGRLVEANDQGGVDSFRESATFYVSRLPRLTTRPEHVAALRQTVVDLAVRGRLVEQDPGEEPATVWLGDRALSPAPGDAPYALPPGWAWSSLNLLGRSMGGGTPDKSNASFWGGDIPWLSPKDMKVDRILDTADHITAAALAESSARMVPKGSLLMVTRGMILAHSFPTALAEVPLSMNQDMKALVPFSQDLAPFLLLLMKGCRSRVLALVLRSTHGTCRLPTDDLLSMALPIPPLAEQARIMARSEELLDACKALASALDDERLRRKALLSAVTSVALG